MVRVAVDVCIGNLGVKRLREAGHDVVVIAEPGEPDLKWFVRAKLAGAEVIISPDRDLAILCYDNRVEYFRAKPDHKGWQTAYRFIQRYGRAA